MTALSMINRFAAPEGDRLILECMLAQSLVRGDQELARELAAIATVLECQQGNVLIEQNSAANDIFFIFVGGFSIIVNGRPIAQRIAHQQVGEMTVIDPKARRSATVVALEESVVARVGEAEFSAIADRHPQLWRRLACELADTLRQRNPLVRQRNATPRLFVGSSSEAREVASHLQAGLAYDPVVVTVWTQGVVGPSDYTMEALERAAAEADLAVLVLGPDDRVTSRGQSQMAPRDNVLLEIGLFIGVLGRQRVFVLMERGTDLKIPTDLLGITPIIYPAGAAEDLGVRLGPACTELRALINARGPR